MAPHVVVAALLLALSTACGATHVVRLNTGEGTPLEYRPTASSKPVEVEAGKFEEALAQMVFDVPVTLRLPDLGRVVPVSHSGPSVDDRWRRLMARSYGGFCQAGQRGGICLSLLDDVLGWSHWDKLGVALALSFEPLKASISRAVEETLAPQLFYGIISTALVTWLVLAANPEPVFTKSAAIVSVVMLAYLGIETFLHLIEASRELKRATDRATSLEELGQAAQHFADRVGPPVARVLVLAVTLVVGPGLAGSTALQASRIAMLPSFTQAAAVGASGVGISLANAGQVSAVVVVGSTVVISLPVTAVAMTAMGSGSAPQTARAIDPNKLHHIFEQEKHKLAPLLEAFGGSREATFRAVESATQNAVRSQGLSGVFTTIVQVAGHTVGVRGRVIGGVAHVGSFWIP